MVFREKRVGCSTIAGYFGDAGKGNRREGFRRKNKNSEISTSRSINQKGRVWKRVIYLYLIGTIWAGLWPFNFWQINNASCGRQDGLRLIPLSTVYSIIPPEKLAKLEKFTVAVNLTSEFFDSNGYARILSYSLDEERRNFMVGQWEDSIVFKLRAIEKKEAIHFETEEVSKKGQKGRIAIIFDGEKMLLYHNGEIKNEKNTGPLSFANWDGSYPLVIGSEANGKFPWKGNIYSIKIFDRALSGEEIRGLASEGSSQKDGEMPLVDYSFGAAGSVIKDYGKGEPADLVIPKRFKPYKRVFLERPGSFKEIWTNITDVLINFFGFLPLGFLFSGYLNRRKWSGKSAFALSLIIGASVSLTIEALQAYLPTRDSSMTDLFCNTLGAGIGSFFCKIK
jgi:glycopeptide antibiotics resistance protein